MDSLTDRPWFYRPVWTADQAAEFLNISYQSVLKLRDDDKLPQLSKLPGVRFRRRDVIALAELTETSVRPFEVAQYQMQIKGLQKENKRLQEIIREILQTCQRGVAVCG